MQYLLPLETPNAFDLGGCYAISNKRHEDRILPICSPVYQQNSAKSGNIRNIQGIITELMDKRMNGSNRDIFLITGSKLLRE